MKIIRNLTTILTLVFILTGIKTNAQDIDNDYSLARVGERIHGVYIFILSDPYQDYEYIATIKVKINWTGTTTESFEKAIKKAKKKYPYFNGMVFQRRDFSKVDLIKFKGLEVSRGGFQIGGYVSFITGYGTTKAQQIGEIIELETRKNKASIKYLDIYGDEKIALVEYGDLTSLEKADYELKIKDHLTEIEKYKFKIGDKVSWIAYSKQLTGEIVKLDDSYHKAGVKYIDQYDKEKITYVPYLNLTKIE
jgi:hypothetical protein